MARPMMLGPALNQVAVDIEDKSLIRGPNLLAEYVPAQRGDAAIAVFPGKPCQIDICKFLADREVDGERDKGSPAGSWRAPR